MTIKIIKSQQNLKFSRFFQMKKFELRDKMPAGTAQRHLSCINLQTFTEVW